jgi:hypothetical protein
MSLEVSAIKLGPIGATVGVGTPGVLARSRRGHLRLLGRDVTYQVDAVRWTVVIRGVASAGEPSLPQASMPSAEAD